MKKSSFGVTSSRSKLRRIDNATELNMSTIRDLTELAEAGTGSAALALLMAARITRPNSGESLPAGGRRRMSNDEAKSLLVASTRQMRVNGVTPHAACKRAAVAGNANNYARFHLTRAEMNELGELVGNSIADRQLTKSVGPIVNLARAISELAAENGRPVPLASLLDELAATIPGYIEPFLSAMSDEFERLADDLASIGDWLSRPRQVDGLGFANLPLVLDFEDAEGVAFDLETGRYESRGDRHWTDELAALPRLGLFVRQVATCLVPCFRRAPDGNGHIHRSRDPFGHAHGVTVELVSLAARRTPGGIAVEFMAEPWTAILTEPGEELPWHCVRPVVWMHGTPYTLRGGRHPDYFYGPTGRVRNTCPVWDAHVEQASKTERGPDAFPEIVDGPRHIPIDAKVLRIWADTRDDRWRSPFTCTPWAELEVLPSEATGEGGVEDPSLLARLAEALYRDERPIHLLLHGQAARRMTAMEEFDAGRVRGSHQRRARFRRQMRS